jgi:hypothetical protein
MTYECNECGLNCFASYPFDCNRKEKTAIKSNWKEVERMEQPELMTLQEAVHQMKEGDKFRKTDPSMPKDDSTAVCKGGLFYWESNGKEIGLMSDTLKMKGVIIPAEPVVLSAEESLKEYLSGKDVFKGEQFLFKAGFYRGEKNGQLKQWLNHKPLREAVERFVRTQNPEHPLRKELENIKPL